jgi:hypothetical protein
MKLVRHGRPGAERPGVIDEDGKLRDLSRVTRDITPSSLPTEPLFFMKATSARRRNQRASASRPRLDQRPRPVGRQEDEQ